jgi:hypothetical protein
MATRVDCVNRCPSRVLRRAVPTAPGVGLDTSPRFGCCTATKVAIRELVANAAARHFSFTVLRSQQSLVPVGELVDFVGRQAAPNCLPVIQNYGVRNAYTTY